MQDKKQQEAQISQWRSAFRGYIWLSTPLPFLYFCCGYLIPDLSTLFRLFTAGIFMLFLFVMYYRYDKIHHYMVQHGEAPKHKGWKKWILRIGPLFLAALLIGAAVNVYIPLYIRGLLASGGYLLMALCWYQNIKTPKEDIKR